MEKVVYIVFLIKIAPRGRIWAGKGEGGFSRPPRLCHISRRGGTCERVIGWRTASSVSVVLPWLGQPPSNSSRQYAGRENTRYVLACCLSAGQPRFGASVEADQGGRMNKI